VFTKEVIELAKPCIEAIKKIAQAKGKKWEWKPEIGDFFLFGKEMGIVVDKYKVNPYTFKGMCVEPKEKRGAVNILYIEDITPIPHWEKLEKIMEGLGYVMDLGFTYIAAGKYWYCNLRNINNGKIVGVYGETRQEAVMRAIIRLSEEIEIDDYPEPDLSKVFKPQIVCKFPERKK